MKTSTARQHLSIWKCLAIAMGTSALILNSSTLPIAASTTTIPFLISQQQTGWESELQVSRLLNQDQEVTDLVIQANLLNKPETTYANAVYQVFARRDSEWQVIYTNVGERLIQNQAGRYLVPPEIIAISDLEAELQDQMNNNNITLEDVDLKTVVQIRYDVRNGGRDQRVEFETEQLTYTSIPHQAFPGQFSLMVLQPDTAPRNMITRMSVKKKLANGFEAEQLLGHYRYRSGQTLRFLYDLNPGDRVIVRLFDTSNRFIGYSEFDCLEGHSFVRLVTTGEADSGIVRTVYGRDIDLDGAIDSSVDTYDYFTQVTTISQTRENSYTSNSTTQINYSNSSITFLEATSSITDIDIFRGWGLSDPSESSRYPATITSGSQSSGTITLTNGYRITFLGVSYQGTNSIWRYYVEELPQAQDLSNWVLGLPNCATVANAFPRGEQVNPDPNAQISGIKWQPGGGFVEGEFAVTLSGQLSVGEIDVAVKGPDVAWGSIAGPSCGT